MGGERGIDAADGDALSIAHTQGQQQVSVGQQQQNGM